MSEEYIFKISNLFSLIRFFFHCIYEAMRSARYHFLFFNAIIKRNVS